jgi:multiple sugar transport system permease protein
MSTRRSTALHLLAIVAFVWTLAPLAWILIVSIMSHHEFASAEIHVWPDHPSLSNYIRLFGFTASGWDGTIQAPSGYGPLIRAGLANSTIVAVLVTMLSLLFAVPASYALARIEMRFRQLGLIVIIATRALPPVAITIPFFELYAALGLSGTLRGLVLAHLTITVPLLVWIGTSFFAGLPPALERVARVDGCSRWMAFRLVMIPASRSAITAMAVIAFLTSWDEFTFALIFSTGTNAQTFPPALSSMFFQISVPTEVAAATVLGLIPPVFVAGFFQRYIRKMNLVTL